MRFMSFELDGRRGVAVQDGDGFRGLLDGEAGYPGSLDEIARKGAEGYAAAAKALSGGRAVDPAQVRVLPPLTQSSKIICVGLNYVDHSAEAGMEVPTYPTLFARFASGLIGDGEALVLPRLSDQFDYEGEMVAVIGKPGRDISLDAALDHVAAYSVFNDGSIRDYQFKAPQWTPGKNFDGTGAFGPVLVTAEELPPGASGLRITTRLNGEIVQDANTSDMVFNVAQLVHTLSAFMTLEAGDVIVTGTPAGVGLARKPPLYMKAGDVCEVEIEGIGLLRNPVRAQ